MFTTRSVRLKELLVQKLIERPDAQLPEQMLSGLLPPLALSLSLSLSLALSLYLALSRWRARARALSHSLSL